MNCKGICIDFKIKTHGPKDGGRYENGQKRCSICNIFIKWSGIRCPCCGTALRMKPKNSKKRQQLVNPA